jgi:hypothetical protein
MTTPPTRPIDKAQATAIARKTIATVPPHSPDLVLQEDRTVERDFGWVFFYTTRKFLETGDKKYLMPGDAPVVVLREDGSTRYLGTSVPPKRAIELFEAEWRANQHP